MARTSYPAPFQNTVVAYSPLKHYPIPSSHRKQFPHQSREVSTNPFPKCRLLSRAAWRKPIQRAERVTENWQLWPKTAAAMVWPVLILFSSSPPLGGRWFLFLSNHCQDLENLAPRLTEEFSHLSWRFSCVRRRIRGGFLSIIDWSGSQLVGLGVSRLVNSGGGVAKFHTC